MKPGVRQQAPLFSSWATMDMRALAGADIRKMEEVLEESEG